MIKRWLKKMNELVPIDDFPSSWGDWVFLIVALALVVVLSVWADAHAQPELKVGQEVSFWTKTDYERWPWFSYYDCFGKIKAIDDEFVVIRPFYDPERTQGEMDIGGGKGFICVSSMVEDKRIPLDAITGYRILKPAPRPEFKLPCIENRGKVPVELPCEKPTHLQYSIEQIADELRYLRGLAGATQGAGREAK